MVMQGIPTQTALGKLIPNNIEATMFAFLTGIIQLTNQYWSKILGTIYNKFVGVEKKNLDDLWKLYMIATISAALPILFLWVAPTNKNISDTQRVIKFVDMYAEA